MGTPPVIMLLNMKIITTITFICKLILHAEKLNAFCYYNIISNIPFKAKLKAMPQKTALPINNKIK